MKLLQAKFFFEKGVTVNFDADAISVFRCGDLIRQFDNAGKRWKPCATHCRDLIHMAIDKPPATNQAHCRAKAVRARPKLAPVGCER